MAGYSEHYKHQQRLIFLDHWVPLDEVNKNQWSDQERWFLARARAAEFRVKQLEDLIFGLQEVTNGSRFQVGRR